MFAKPRPRGTPPPSVPLELHELTVARMHALAAGLAQALKLVDVRGFMTAEQQIAWRGCVALLAEGT